jgi:KipI family sensor histidine kinase inhibitor
MGWRALGDSAWLFVATAGEASEKFAQILRMRRQLDAVRLPQIRDLVSSFDSVAVHFDPRDGEAVMEWLKTIEMPATQEDAETSVRMHEIPLRYGNDLEKVAKKLGRTVDEVIHMHSAATYTVAAIGFSPGFPFLIGLPEELRLPRLDTPRPVSAGSIAIAGDQAGIYPFDSQGGWHVIGQTSLTLFDPQNDSPALLSPGDRVRFTAVESLPSCITISNSPSANAHGAIEIVEAGPLTSVQDLGRHGYQSIGVTPGGVMDPIAAKVANRLLGNPDGHALLECAMLGPVLKFHRACRIALLGWSDHRCGRPIEMAAGEVLDLRSPTIGSYGYLAIAGGIDVPQVLDSRSTDLRAKFGGHHGRRLQNGDRLEIGEAPCGPRSADWHVRWPYDHAKGLTLTLRYIRGMQSDWFSPSSLEAFANSEFRISSKSDRVGMRLDGPKMSRVTDTEMVSQAVVRGSIQVPPDGTPIMLMAECQTIGGYPQIGHVISADLPKLARVGSSTSLRFREVTLDEARMAWNELERDMKFLRTGLELLK